MSWRDSTLGALTKLDGGLIQTGPFGSQLHQAEYEAEGVPVVMPKDITDGGISSETVARVSEETAARLERHKLKPRSIVLPRRGEITKRAFIRDAQDGWLCGTGCLKIELNGDHLVPEYLYYFMEQEHVTKWLLQHAVGSTMLNLSAGIVAAMPVRYPAINVQQAIAETLSTYDDLIDNNRRRMALLEDSARQLYREWFVRLRFPGHEHTSIVDGVPQGWRKVSLAEITSKIGSGSTPKGGEAAYQPEGVTLIRSMNVYDDLFDDAGLAFLNDGQAAGLANVVVEPNDILLNITGASVARCCMAPERYLPARVNQHVMIIRVDPKKASPFFVHKAINSDECKRLLLSFARKGSTREALTKEEMANFEITIPTSALMEQFGEIAADAYAQREGLAKQNHKLRQARDLLLPRLMNGELAV